MIEPDLDEPRPVRPFPVARLAALALLEFGLLWSELPGSAVLAVTLSAAIGLFGVRPNHRGLPVGRREHLRLAAFGALAGLAGGAGLHLLNTSELARVVAVVLLVALWLVPRLHRWMPRRQE